ncbi:FAD-binding oxidoreductase [Solirubrobacter sp. CPCC 204708]|uniref:FAD-binding oxidoreductase n=1 Tax=Solirubrobacter deserti TaxID=2282478 RepID=A0ABT4RCA8_9ACTN|nr:FAD-binding oxidoreductase [Solirubrobacter deserti]MBE2315514.1 FAD-binding oxidoreductase [Solirubrobacter deserti]MDA0136153.1 FAD-binding oxidoreductase [Solirubrobacter deserti]
MKSSVTQLVELAPALAAVLGGDAVLTDDAQLDAYTADTYWPAIHARAAGAPLGRPDVVAVPRREEDVATILRIAASHRVPVTAWGGGSGTQGGAVAIEGGLVVDLRGLDTIVEIDEVSMTVTAQAGVNGNVLERTLNERGLMLPHYPASSEWATVGGYVAARGSGVLSTRYGKIEDLVLGLRVALPDGTFFDSVPAPRHAVGPDLTPLFVGSEGTLGIITRATLEVVPAPAERTFAALHFPSVHAGVDAFRTALARGNRPSVIRMYDEEATRRTLSPVVGEGLDGVVAIVVFEGGEPEVTAAERAATIGLARTEGARELDPALARTWWDRRYDFYKPPHHPELPSVWGTIDVVASYRTIHDVHRALQTAVRDRYAPDGLQLRMHFSHWYRWGTMIYARFLIPDGGQDARELHDQVWADGVTAVLAAGGVMNDHHGVGLKLAPFMQAQHGAGLEALRSVKSALDPLGIMNPGKLGL